MLSDPVSEIVVKSGRLYHLGITDGEVAPNLFLVGDPARAYRVAERFDSVTYEIKNREYLTLTGVLRGIDMSVIGTGIGTDNVEIALIEAFAAIALDLETGRRKRDIPPIHIIRIGTSGGVQPDIEPGALGLSEYALGLDSTGLFYDHPVPDSLTEQIEREAEPLLNREVASASRFKGRIQPYASKASQLLYRELVQNATALGIGHAAGITVATPGFYGPSGRFIEGLRNTVPRIKQVLAELRFQGRRIINCEMESSLLFHLARPLGVRAATVCPIISQPDPGGLVVDYRPHVEQAIDLAISAIESAGKPRS